MKTFCIYVKINAVMRDLQRSASTKIKLAPKPLGILNLLFYNKIKPRKFCIHYTEKV